MATVNGLNKFTWQLLDFFLLESGTLNRRYLGILSFHFCLNIRSVGRDKEFFVLQAF